MLISDAINQAADHIEQNPKRYSFNQGHVLGGDDSGVPACMLARIGEMAGYARGTSCDTVARGLLGVNASEFYDRIMQAAGHPGNHAALYCVALVPDAMRSYAKKYHGIPEEVRAIFNSDLFPWSILASVRVSPDEVSRIV